MKQANPINIATIDHVVIRVNDLGSMIDWYVTVLGCRLERGPGEMRLAQLRAGTSLIDLVDASGPLGKKSGGKPDHTHPNLDHVCLQVVPWSEDAILAHLQRHNVSHDGVADRYGAKGQGPSVYIQDPEGNSVELKG